MLRRTVEPFQSDLRDVKERSDADRRLSVLLRLHGLRREIAAEAWRLLRVLFVRLRAVSADAGGALCGWRWRQRWLPVTGKSCRSRGWHHRAFATLRRSVSSAEQQQPAGQ